MASSAKTPDLTELYRPELQIYRDKIDGWKKDHDEANQCSLVENILAFGLYLYSQITKAAKLALDRASDDGREAVQQDVAELFDWWYAPCSDILQAVHHYEALGYDIEDAEPFARACGEAEIAAHHWKETLKALRQVEHGDGQSVSEVIGELRGED